MNTKKAWLSSYFYKSSNEVGVYFRTQYDQEGREVRNSLLEHEEAIKLELTENLSWWDWDARASCGISMDCHDIFDLKNRESLKKFFSNKLNLYVNVFRPRMKSVGL